MVKNILKRFGVLLLSLTLLLPYFPAYAWEDTDAETAEMGGGTNHFTIEWRGYQEPGSAPILRMHLHSNTTGNDYYGNEANFLTSDGKIRAKHAVKAGASLADALHAFGITDEKIKEHYSINPGGTANNGCYAKYNLNTNHGKKGSIPKVKASDK